MTRLGQILVRADLVSENHLARALGVQHFAGGRIGTLLLERGALHEDDLGRALAEQHDCEYVPWPVLDNVSPAAIAAIPAKFAIRHCAIAWDRGEGFLRIALRDPSDLRILDELFFVTGRKVIPCAAPEVRIYHALEKYYGERRTPRFAILAEKLSRIPPRSALRAVAPPPPPDFFPESQAKRPAAEASPEARAAAPSSEARMPDAPVVPLWTPVPPSAPTPAGAPEDEEVISWEELSPPPMWIPEALPPPTPRAPEAPPPPTPRALEAPPPPPVIAVIASAPAPPIASANPAPPSAPAEAPPPIAPAPPPPQEAPAVAAPPAPEPAAAEAPRRRSRKSRAVPKPAPTPAPEPPPAPAEAPAPPPPAAAAPASPPARPAPLPVRPAPASRRAPGGPGPEGRSFAPETFDFPDVHSARDRGQVIAAAMIALTNRFPRAAVFGCKPDRISGLAGGGKGIDPSRVAAIDVPWGDPSVFLNVRLSRAFYLGALPPLPRHKPIADAMGKWAEECVVQPVWIKDKPVAFLYAEFDPDRGATPMDLAYLRGLASAAATSLAASIRSKRGA